MSSIKKSILNQYTLVTTIIAIALIQVCTSLLGYLNKISPASIYELDLDNLINNYVVTKYLAVMALTFVLVNFVPIFIYFFVYSLYNEKSQNRLTENTVNYWYHAIIHFIFYSAVIYICMVFIVPLIVKFESILVLLSSTLLIPMVLLLAQFLLKKYNISLLKRVNTLYLISLIITGILVNYYYFNFKEEANLTLEKEVYTFTKDNYVKIEIPGTYLSYNLLVKNEWNESFPAYSYFSNSKTVIVVDLTSSFFVEGEYEIELKIKDEPINKRFVYIFDGLEKDKAIYLDRFITQLERVSEFKNVEEKSIYFSKLPELKQAYLNREYDKAIELHKQLVKISPESSNKILVNLKFDRVVGFEYRTNSKINSYTTESLTGVKKY